MIDIGTTLFWLGLFLFWVVSIIVNGGLFADFARKMGEDDEQIRQVQGIIVLIHIALGLVVAGVAL